MISWLLAVGLTAASDAHSPWLSVAATSGLTAPHTNLATGEVHFFETASAGVGLIDFDGDGDLDIYMPNGGANRLYENNEGTFVDRSRSSGTDDTGYGMGLCAGDVNADGHIDFLVTNFGPDRLYVNAGDGTFDERSQFYGLTDDRWSTGCAFGDLDGDRDLDLYIAHYAEYDRVRHPVCKAEITGERFYCQPKAFPGQPDSLYEFDDGRFKDISNDSGISRGVDDRGFSVSIADFNDDGRPDIYVANDGTMNRLYLNEGGLKFDDSSLMSGTGLNAMGRPEAGMGVAVADLVPDSNGADIFVTNYAMEQNTLYTSAGDDYFEDRSLKHGLARISLPWVGWGTVAADFDMDGQMDLAIANGHPLNNIEVLEPGLSYQQPNQIFLQSGLGEFVPPPYASESPWTKRASSRGMAAGDIDNDGCIDLLIVNVNDVPDLLRNDCQVDHWIGVKLRDSSPNVFAFGARARLTSPTRSGWRRVSSGESFLSQSDLRLVFPLPPHAQAVLIEVIWADQTRELFQMDATEEYSDLERGDGQPCAKLECGQVVNE